MTLCLGESNGVLDFGHCRLSFETVCKVLETVLKRLETVVISLRQLQRSLSATSRNAWLLCRASSWSCFLMGAQTTSSGAGDK